MPKLSISDIYSILHKLCVVKSAWKCYAYAAIAILSLTCRARVPCHCRCEGKEMSTIESSVIQIEIELLIVPSLRKEAHAVHLNVFDSVAVPPKCAKLCIQKARHQFIMSSGWTRYTFPHPFMFPAAACVMGRLRCA